MKKLLILTIIGLLTSPVANAVPDLQLFVTGDYDWETETWITTSSSFDLYVVSAKHENLDVIVCISLATTDLPGDVSIEWDSSPVEDWVWGYAPIDNLPADWNGGEDLPRHGNFPTWFAEVDAGDYYLSDLVGDVQPDENGIYWDPSGGNGGGEATRPGMVRSFHVDVGGAFTYIHFDAYTLNEDGTINRFAPFSHDAGVVPEPGTIILLGTGLVGIGLSIRRRRKK